MKFEELGLAETLLRAVCAQGYTTPTKIQAAAIPPVLEGRDVLGCAQTGTGKTAAFALPTLQRLSRQRRRSRAGRGRKIRTRCSRPRANWRSKSARASRLRPLHRPAPCGHLRRRRPAAAGPGLEGGRRHPRRHARPPARPDAARLRRPGARRSPHPRRGRPDARHGLHPRSAADRGQGAAAAADAAVLGHHAARRFASWPTSGSAIRSTCASVRVGARSSTIRQSVFFVDQANKIGACSRIGCRRTPGRGRWSSRGPSTAPTRSPSCCCKAGIEADAFHSNKSQSARQRSLARFKSPQPLVLVATDIAARGLDIDMVSHVINFDSAGRRGELRPPHRPHRPGGGRRRGRLVLRLGRAKRFAGDPTPDAANARGRAPSEGLAFRACHGRAIPSEDKGGVRLAAV